MRKCKVCGATDKDTKIYGEYCRKHYLQIARHGHIIERTIYDKNNIVINDGVAIMDLYDKQGNKIAETKFDAALLNKVKAYKWYLRIHEKHKMKLGYVMGTVNGSKVFLHRYLLDIPKSKVVDHINGDTLDNRFENIRECNQAQNSRNRIYKSSKGKVPGVYQQYGPNSNYSVRICYNYKTIHIGTYKTYEEAVKARLEAEQKYFGKYAASSGQRKQQNGGKPWC